MIMGFGLLGIVGMLSSCASDDEDGGGIDDLPIPAAVNCVDPAQCLSIIATWCVPGEDCTTNDVDLSLVLPSLTPPVGIRTDEIPNLNGCIHGGDEVAGLPFDRNGDGDPGPFTENITCSPTLGPTPISPGIYTVQVRDNFSFFDTGPIVVDINVDGVNQRQVVNVDNGSTAEIPVTYP